MRKRTILCCSAATVFVLFFGCHDQTENSAEPTISFSPAYVDTVADSHGQVSVAMENYGMDIEITDQAHQAIPNAHVAIYQGRHSAFIWADGGGGLLDDGEPDVLSGYTVVNLGEVTNGTLDTPWITIGILLFAVGSAAYEYLTDPPNFDNLLGDEAFEDVCIPRGDLNDVLSVMSLVGTGAAAIRVAQSASPIRGVTAINLGFSRREFSQQFFFDRFFEAVGILDCDVIEVCYSTLPIGDLDYHVPVVQINSFVSECLDPPSYTFFLEWQDVPPDLDLHLFVPYGSDEWYDVRGPYGSEDNYPYAKGSRDDLNGGGPEAVRVYQRVNGTYWIIVHDYPGGGGSLNTSGIIAKLYRERDVVTTVMPPNTPASDGWLWYVATLDGGTGAITVVNELHPNGGPVLSHSPSVGISKSQ